MISKKKHHFLPIMYLKEFLDKQKMVWTYEKNSGKSPYPQKPKNTALEKDFYSIMYDNGEKSEIFENLLAEIIEFPSVQALKKLISGEDIKEEDKQKLSMFLGFLYVRTPTFRRKFEDSYSKELNLNLKFLANNSDDFLKKEKKSIEELYKEILNGNLKLRASPNISLYMLYQIGFDLAFSLANMRWVIIKTPNEKFFITSDNPMIIIPNMYIFFPISNEIGLLITNNNILELDKRISDNNECKKLVDEINKKLIFLAKKYIYANQKSEKLKSIIEKI